MHGLQQDTAVGQDRSASSECYRIYWDAHTKNRVLVRKQQWLLRPQENTRLSRGDTAMGRTLLRSNCDRVEFDFHPPVMGISVYLCRPIAITVKIPAGPDVYASLPLAHCKAVNQTGSLRARWSLVSCTLPVPVLSSEPVRHSIEIYAKALQYIHA